ncbi:hypothetical protein CPB86DRAFT_872205 [Serendipita vermifera]|nr:hypothetical protein CPB86DRAFT_872205 [Serendipita vermifera]
MPTLKNTDASTSERSVNVKKATETNGSTLSAIKEPSEKRKKKSSEKNGEQDEERPRKKRSRIEDEENISPKSTGKHKKHKKSHNTTEINERTSTQKEDTSIVDKSSRQAREGGESSGARHKKAKKHKETLVHDSWKSNSPSTTTKDTSSRQAIIPVDPSPSTSGTSKKPKEQLHQDHPHIDPVLLNYDSLEPSSFGIDANASSDDIWRAIRSMDNSALSKAVGRDIPAPTRTEKSGKHRISKRAVASDVDDPNDFATILSTKWLTAPMLKQLSEKHGMDYKKGAFTTSEKSALEDAIDRYSAEHVIIRDEVIDIMFTKRGSVKPEHSNFWTHLASAVPMRPLIAVFNYCKRAYHPLQKQGKWTEEEDELLRKAVQEYGQLWETVSEKVGRMASDCRDRYRNHKQHVTDRKAGTISQLTALYETPIDTHLGAWSKEEEDQLVEIMKDFEGEKDKDNDVLWSEVVKRMGGTRSRAQIKTKWYKLFYDGQISITYILARQDNLNKRLKADGGRRWLPFDSYILVHKIASMNVTDDSEIDWKLLSDDGWNLWSPHILQKRWLNMKRGIVGHEEMPFHELLDILIAKKGSLSQQQLEDGLRKTQDNASHGPRIVSEATIEDSDVDVDSE